MAFHHSKVSAFSLAGTDLSDFVDSVSITHTAEASEVTTIGQASKSYIQGLKDATISISGKYDPETAGPEATIRTAISGGVAVAFSFEPAGAGETDYSGNCLVTSFEVSAPVGEVVAFTAEMQVTGGLTITPGA